MKNNNLEISFFEILASVKNGWKLILLAAFIGAIIQCANFYSRPKIFEAQALIGLGAIYNSSPSINASVSREQDDFFIDPVLLIGLIRNPTTYSDVLVDKCSSGSLEVQPESIAKSTSLTKYMGANLVLELKVNSNTQGAAINCLNGIIEELKRYEKSAMKFYFEAIEARLKILNSKINNHQKLIGDMKGNGELFFMWGLRMIDELSRLENQRDSLNFLIDSRSNSGLKLIGEPYASAQPINKPLKYLLLEGFLLGGIFGLIIIFLRLGVKKIKNNGFL